MPGVTIHYLLVYNYEGQNVVVESFKDSKKATNAYAAKEVEYAGRSDEFEVVLVGADSLDTIMKTHGHYFAKASDSLFSEFLMEPLSA